MTKLNEGTNENYTMALSSRDFRASEPSAATGTAFCGERGMAYAGTKANNWPQCGKGRPPH